MSRKRPGNIPVLKKLFPWATLCIAEDEKDEYSAWPGNFLLHPDNVVGLSVTRQWILDYFRKSNESFFVLDDDISEVVSLVGRTPRKIAGSDEIKQLIDNCAVISYDAGIPVFGFENIPSPKFFHADFPFQLKEWTGSAWGMHPPCPEINFDMRLPGREDLDFCLQCLRKYRLVYKDTRFCFVMQRNYNRGGAQDLRTSQKERNNLKLLQRKWGGAIKLRDWKGTTIVGFRVKRQSPHVSIK